VDFQFKHVLLILQKKKYEYKFLVKLNGSSEHSLHSLRAMIFSKRKVMQAIKMLHTAYSGNSVCKAVLVEHSS
jgi:hypothetical protein